MVNRINAHAARLVANFIISYCSIILNNIYVKMLKAGVAQEVIDQFLRISPISWAHILFAGRYSFLKSTGNINIVEMVQEMERHLKQSFWRA